MIALDCSLELRLAMNVVAQMKKEMLIKFFSNFISCRHFIEGCHFSNFGTGSPKDYFCDFFQNLAIGLPAGVV